MIEDMIEDTALSSSLRGSVAQFGRIFCGRGIYATTQNCLPVGSSLRAVERLQRPSYGS
jgi:hypothetical protein